MARKKKQNYRKKLTYAIISAVFFLVTLTGVAYVARLVTLANNDQTITSSIKSAADQLKQQGIDQMQSNPEQATQTLQSAEKQYKSILSNSDDQATRDTAQNEIVDCEALIWLLTH